MAANKSNLPKPKAVSEAVITKDAFMALIRKYKNTSVAAAALVFALTSFMGISAFKAYSTHHTAVPEVKAAQSLQQNSDEIISEAASEPQPSPQSTGVVNASSTIATVNQNALTNNPVSTNAFADPTLPPKAHSPQFNTDTNCTFVSGVPASGKVCKVHDPSL